MKGGSEVPFAVDAVDTHVQGDHARVVLGGGVGLLTTAGSTMFERMKQFERESDWFRLLMLREPRGYPQSCVNLVVPPVDPSAAAGLIIMEQQRYYAAMSGTNVIAVATVLLETGLVSMTEPITDLLLEPPAGLIEIRAHCEGGRAKRVDFTNVPSFCSALDVPLAVPGFGTVTVSVAFGGMAYAIVDAAPLGFEIRPSEARALQEASLAITAAAGEHIGFVHPLNPEIRAIEGTVLYRRPDRPDGVIRQAPITIAGNVGRTPAGTGCSATMAVLHARTEKRVGDAFAIAGMFDNSFQCTIREETMVGDREAIVPVVGGQAFITAYSRYVLMDDDPFPQGFMVGDIWSMANESSPAFTLGTRPR
jgi:proline racemase